MSVIISIIFIWFLFAYGLCNILIFGSNFQWWRDLLAKFGTGGYSLHKLFTCMICLPTWVGFAMSFLGQKFLGLSFGSLVGVENLWIAIFIDGIMTSGGVWLIHTFQEMMERAYTNNEEGN
jgi:hypothetical protein